MDRPIGTKPPLLSKSRFLAGLQCPLRLWYQCFEPQLATEAGPAQQAIFDTGHAVGRLATGRYPGGTLIAEDHRHHTEAVRATAAAMNRADTPAVYEAAFDFEGIRIRVDVLERCRGGRWNLVEVKSATGVKDVHVWDVAVQHHVLAGCGLQIERAGLLHLNTAYVHPGPAPVLGELFHLADLTPPVLSRRADTRVHLQRLREVLSGAQPPAIEPSRHCKSPYLCEFWDHCTGKMPEFWILQLSGISQSRLDELSRMGISDIRDIPESFPLTEIQERIRTCVQSRAEFISPVLNSVLCDMQHPIHFLDFETVAPAVPRYPGTRPYQNLAFQFSDHVLQRDGTIDHRTYLCRKDKDPREEFTRALLDALDSEGSIVIYTTYEKEIIRALASDFPEMRSPLHVTLDRMRDLHAIIKKNYYHPGFRGSFSLKSVLPTLLPEMSYQDLAIQEGSQASLEYLRMIDPQTPAAEKKDIEQNLLAYCAQDTLAMVRIRETLLNRS
jgi:predicted RecB family nuclease